MSDIYSVSSCVSEDFGDWVDYWKHNGYWLFDSLEIVEEIAVDNNLTLKGMKAFFYYAYECQWDDEWVGFSPEQSFATNVIVPEKSTLEGFDVVTYSSQNAAECSPLSCNSMAKTVSVNSHCLLESLEEAKRLLESGAFKECEPGPYRVIEVHSL